MGFLPSSRYAALETVEVPTANGKTATIVKLRRLPPIDGDPVTVAAHDRLDIIAHERYGDSTEFWYVADANTDLDATELAVPNRTIKVPAK
jgi:hypothetical protein